MSSDYTLILRSCPEGHRESAAIFLGKLFSLKEHTCQQIVGSSPIVLLTGLGREEAAAVHMLAHGMSQVGASLELVPHPAADLPKIDWPRRPQVFKRELTEWVSDLQMTIPVPGGTPTRLLDLLLYSLEGGRSGKAEFRGQSLPEVTPVATPLLPPPDGGALHPPAGGALPPIPTPKPTARTPLPPPPGGDDAMSRLNELFPEEEGGGFMPGKDDITNILNRILPDEQGGGGGGGDGAQPTSRRVTNGGSFSVFLAKIADEDRRKKAVALIAELSKIPVEEAEALSKKMIIPALRGATKDEAEAAKAQFGKIGILARVKGPE